MHVFHIRYRNTQGTLMRILNAASRRGIDIPYVQAEPTEHTHQATLLLDVNAKQLGQLIRDWRAIVDVAKLRDYCLNPAHPRGRHKARVFASTPGLTRVDAEFLREAWLLVTREQDATEGNADEYGERSTIDFSLVRHPRRAVVRSTWIVVRGERFPRLTSCYVRLN